jgi:tetratricopeptide (TPR) repeat protein
VTDPHQLASLRVDARAQTLLAALPDLFDVDAALEAEVARLQVGVQQAPRSLRALNRLLEALCVALHYDEVLRRSGEALDRARVDASSYSDTDDSLPWVMDFRAVALQGLGRWQEAAEQFLEASRLPEGKAPNVSQVINLAALHCRLDQPREALAKLDGLGAVSPYGRMQVERVRLMAAVELGNEAAAEVALAYLREHRTDSQRTLQWALIVADRLDEAAGVMVERLLDPATRREMLLGLQEFAPAPRTPRSLIWSGRWDEVVARPEVQSAIARVGRIERFRIGSAR